MAGQLCSVPVLVLLVAALLPPARSQFASSPDSVTLNEGDFFSTTCDYPGAVALVWRRNDVTIDEEDSSFQIETSGHVSVLNITSADHTLHNGSYSCVAVLNNSMQVSANFTITVYYIGSEISIRRINTECSPTDIYINTTFTLECLPPNGFPQVTVTWYRGGDKIRQNEDNPAVDFSNSRRLLTIDPVSYVHVGHYHCEAANEANEGNPLVSALLEIRVLHPDIDTDGTVAILDSSTPQLVGAGRNTKLVCQIIPAPNINNVEWTRDGDDIMHNGDDLRIVQSPSLECLITLHIDDVTPEKEGVYECRDSTMSHQFAQRQVAIAHLSGPLVVEATPGSLVGQNRTLRLECRLAEEADSSANNVPPQDFQYSWSLNGTVIEASGGRLLDVTEISLTQSGRYGCTVSHPEITSPITAFINITVEARPNITLTPSPSSQVELGSTVTLRCRSASPRPSSFSWLKNGTAVQEDGRHDVSSSQDTSTLTISRLEQGDLHTYLCVANDSVHELQQSVELSESGQLYIVGAAAGLQDKSFPTETSLTLVCVTRGGDGRGVRWFQGDVLLSDQGDVGAGQVHIVSNDSSSLLTISRVGTSEAGNYSCATVDGNTGTESRRSFRVTITVPGRIVSTSRYKVEGEVGSRVQFDCFTSGIPPPTVSWLYKSRPIPTLDEDSIMDRGNGTLVIDPVRQDLAGVYHCLVDSKSANFTLKVVAADTEEEDSGGCGTFSQSECIILSSVGAVVVFLAVVTAGVMILCVCVLYRRSKRGSYPIAREMDGVELKRSDSSRASIRKDNSGILTSAASNNFFGDQFAANHYGKALYPPSLPITPYGGSVISEMRHSITPPAPSPVPQTPGTAGTDSLFSSDDQSSLAASLPNFPRTNLKLGEEMGEGEFGPVILGVAKNILPHEERTQVAVKVLVRGGEGDDHFRPDLALVDFANQMKLDYEHIACIIGLCTDTEPYYVLYEYMDQGDLKKYLLSNQPTEEHPSLLTQQVLSRVVLQVADGMAYLFSQRIIHGDLATRNCLISSDHRVKIADLGIGHDLYSSDYYDNGSQLLPIRWMPPELLLQTDGGPSFSLHSDIWSFGILCWEVFTFARLPYEDWSDQEVLERVPLGELLPIPAEGCPAHMYSVMVQCWHQDPDARPRFAKLCMTIMNMGLD